MPITTVPTHTHPIVLRLTQEMFVRLAENRRMTGVTVSEFCRRAINLALFADEQAANRHADRRETCTKYMEANR